MLKIKSIKPMFDSLVTTMNKYEQDGFENGVIVKQAGSLKEYQTVIAVGPAVRNIEVGDVVCINPIRYARKKHQDVSLKDGIITDNPVVDYNFNVVDLDDTPHLLLQDCDISFIIEDFEDIPDPKPLKLYKPKNKIIV